MLLYIKGFYSTKIYKEHYWSVNIYSWIWIHFCPFTLKPKGCFWKYNEHTWLPCFPKVIMDSSTSPHNKLKVTFKSLLCLPKVWFKASQGQCLPPPRQWWLSLQTFHWGGVPLAQSLDRTQISSPRLYSEWPYRKTLGQRARSTKHLLSQLPLWVPLISIQGRVSE